MRKFLASVGNAKLLGKVDGKLEHIANVRTLTESTLSFSNTQEEIRAGEGAQLMGRFSHDSGLTITLTDAMFNLKYIEKQVGASVLNNPSAIQSEKLTVGENGVITLTKDAVKLGEACGLDHAICWVRKTGCENGKDYFDADSTKIYYANGKTVDTKGDFASGDIVCVEYFATKEEAQGILVNANFIPAELILIITTKLFAGDSNAPETGTPVGWITIKIPRFSLDGTFDLSMAMSSAATMSLAGTALAVESMEDCEGKGVYAEIVEVAYNSKVTDGLKDVIVDEDTLKVGEVPGVFGLYSDGHISEISKENYAITNAEGQSALDGKGKFSAAGAYTVTVGVGKEAKKDDITVANAQ